MTQAYENLQRALQASQDLTGHGRLKNLCQQFAAGCDQVAGCDVSFYRLGLRDQQVFLKPRQSISSTGLLSRLDHVALASHVALLCQSDQGLRQGVTSLDLGRETVLLAFYEDARSSRGAVAVLASATPSMRLNQAQIGLVEIMARAFQNESRWLRKLSQAQLELYRDDLTGLYNYRYFEVSLEQELKRAERFHDPFCLLFVDLDGFKPVNDNHGHLSGSDVLRQVAEVIRRSVRDIDIPIRYGGDEFVIVLLGASTAKGLLAAERLRRNIEANSFRLDQGGTVRLTASIGVAAYPEHGRDRETLVRMADETMYKSKKTGKNRVTVVQTQT